MELLMAAESGAASGSGGYWQLALVLAGIGLLGLLARWRKARAEPPPPSAKELRERDKAPNRYRDAADRALVDLIETGREIGAQVDTKIRMLNRLVKEAEEKIARLEGLLGQAGERLDNPGSASPAPPPPAVPDSGGAASADSTATQSFRSELHERILLLRNEGKSVQEIAKATNLSTTEVRFAIGSMGADA